MNLRIGQYRSQKNMEYKKQLPIAAIDDKKQIYEFNNMQNMVNYSTFLKTTSYLLVVENTNSIPFDIYISNSTNIEGAYKLGDTKFSYNTRIFKPRTNDCKYIILTGQGVLKLYELTNLVSIIANINSNPVNSLSRVSIRAPLGTILGINGEKLIINNNGVFELDIPKIKINDLNIVNNDNKFIINYEI